MALERPRLEQIKQQLQSDEELVNNYDNIIDDLDDALPAGNIYKGFVNVGKSGKEVFRSPGWRNMPANEKALIINVMRHALLPAVRELLGENVRGGTRRRRRTRKTRHRKYSPVLV